MPQYELNISLSYLTLNTNKYNLTHLLSKGRHGRALQTVQSCQKMKMKDDADDAVDDATPSGGKLGTAALDLRMPLQTSQQPWKH